MNCHTIGGCLLHTFVDKHAWGSGGGGAAMHARENVGERAAGTSIMYALHVCMGGALARSLYIRCDLGSSASGHDSNMRMLLDI